MKMVMTTKMKTMNISPLMLFAGIVAFLCLMPTDNVLFVNAKSEEGKIENKPLNNDSVDIDRNLIVGGEQSDEQEFPYFAHTLLGGCGGVLVANDWVLTAAHCGNMTDTQVVIGAYEYFSNTYGGQTRDCIIYIEESNFKCRTEVGEGSECNQSDIFNESPFRNDYALCKLNLPVYVDDTKVKLELNTNKKFPSNGDDVVAIGFGTTSLGGSQPQFLQDVTIKVKSNKQCRKVDNALYNSNSIGPESICASVPNGGKDSCQGDSGGPLIKRTFDPNDNNKSVHTHVGITSWAGSCGDKGIPGVYARTSAGYDFIKRTICEDYESKSPFCQEPVTCDDENATKLTIKLVPDYYPEETSYYLKDITDVNNPEELLSVGPLDELIYRYFTFEETICLPPGRQYQFEIRDEKGDGLETIVDGEVAFVGFYSLILNDIDEIKTSRNNNFDSNDIHEFTTPTEIPKACVDSGNEVVVFKTKKGRKKKKKCSWVKGKKKVIRRKCKKKYNGVKVFDACPLTCGKKVGLGRCANLKESSASR